MKTSWKIYLFLVVVFSFSVFITLLVSDVYKGLASIPATGSLIYALYQIFRDQSAFEKKKYLQQQQQIFNIGSTSHMANVVFDKHVEFVERYMEEVDRTVSSLLHDGPTREAIKLSDKLFHIKRRYAAWIPNPAKPEPNRL